MTLPGVEGPTKYVGKDNFEVRVDGFGRMTDEEVKIYKKNRPRRYGQSDLWDAIELLQKRIDDLEKGGH